MRVGGLITQLLTHQVIIEVPDDTPADQLIGAIEIAWLQGHGRMATDHRHTLVIGKLETAKKLTDDETRSS